MKRAQRFSLVGIACLVAVSTVGVAAKEHEKPVIETYSSKIVPAAEKGKGLAGATAAGNRRVIFVVENGKRMNQLARKTASAIVSRMISKGRAEDSFAMVTAGGSLETSRFDTSRSALIDAAQNLVHPSATRTRRQGVLDAVREATNMLQPAQPGDSIIVLAMNLEGKHHAKFPKVRQEIAAGKIRIFGFELGEVHQPDTLSEFPSMDSYYSLPAVVAHNVDHLAQLSRDSGGAVFFINTKLGKREDLSSVRMQRLLGLADHVYLLVVQ